jgi:hypothetical protein
LVLLRRRHTRDPVVARTASGRICTNTHSPTVKRGHTAPPREATPRGAREVAFSRVVVLLGGDPKCTADRSGRWPQGAKPVSGMPWGAPGDIAG